MSNKGKMKSKN